jgi:hypothetical protein
MVMVNIRDKKSEVVKIEVFKSEQKLGDFIQQFWQISDVTL